MRKLQKEHNKKPDLKFAGFSLDLGATLNREVLLQIFLTPRYLAIAMEYAKGGDLFGYIIRNSPVGRLPEDHAQSLFQQLILGVDFCHRMVSHTLCQTNILPCILSEGCQFCQIRVTT